MPEEKANLSKQPAPEKKSDATKMPTAPPKQDKSPEKAVSEKSGSATESKNADAPALSLEKSADSKPGPATNAKKVEPPVKPQDKAGDAKTVSAPAKPPDKISTEKIPPIDAPKKPDVITKPPEKAVDAKSAPATEQKKPDVPAKPPDKVSGAETAAVPAKPPDNHGSEKAAPAAELKKPDAPVKPALNKPVPPSAQKAEPSAKIMLGGKPHDPITPPKAADPLKEPGEFKGVRVTQIFEDRLDYPDEKALNSLPIPKEGEGVSMRLHPAYFYQFLDHPFSVNREVKDYIELYESIRDNGINEPVKARPREKGGLELISGHRRHDIASRLNYPVPVIIAQVDDDTARVEVVDGNLHRMDIPTSELARAAKMKMEALARKAGRRSKIEMLTNPGPQKRTDQIVADEMGISRNQVNRLVKINDLVPELKQQVDDKKLPFNTAVELAYMKPEEQNRVVDVMKKEQIIPSMAQATALKEASRHADTMQKNLPSLAPAHKIDENKIASIIKPKKEPELRVTFTGAELKVFFPNGTPSVAEVKRVVFDALRIREEAYKRQAKKQAAKDAIKSPEH